MKFFYSTWIRPLAVWAGVFLTITAVNGQTDLVSPYSIFGPGLPFQRQTVSQAGMGGSGMSWVEPYKMNFANPAMVAYHLEPIFEGSTRGTFSTFETSDESFENRAFTINNISLTFPIKRGSSGISLGILPLTTTGYDITTGITNSDVEDGALVNYSGDGGISQAYLGGGVKILNKVDTAGNVTALSIGANINYNFGTIDNNRQLLFPGNPDYLAFQSNESILVRGLTMDFGVHFQKNLINRTILSNRYLKLLLGATYTLGMDNDADRSGYVYNLALSGQVGPRDTLVSNERVDGSIKLPSGYLFSAGLDYVSEKRTRLRFAFDYGSQAWSEYQTSFASQSEFAALNDNQRLGVGLELTPTLGSTKYLRTVEYRMGFKYEQTNLSLENTAIDDVGMSFGVSLPLHHRRGLTKSSIHLSGQYGSFGTTDNNLIREEYYRVFIGFSFTPHFRNRWFVQPKYD